MSKIRLIAVIFFLSIVTIGAATLIFIEGTESNSGKSSSIAMDTMAQPQVSRGAWKDDTGAAYRRLTEASDSPDARQQMRAIPTVWQDPPRR